MYAIGMSLISVPKDILGWKSCDIYALKVYICLLLLPCLLQGTQGSAHSYLTTTMKGLAYRREMLT